MFYHIFFSRHVFSTHLRPMISLVKDFYVVYNNRSVFSVVDLKHNRVHNTTAMLLLLFK